MAHYKGYSVFGKAEMIPASSPAWWRSQGNVFTNTQEGSILIKQLEGVMSSLSPNKPPKLTA
jgi:hypothetical protein